MYRLTRSCSAIILTSLAWTLVLADQENLLSNPGFEVVMEEGEIEGWEVGPDGPGRLAAVTEAGQVRSGQRAARLEAVINYHQVGVISSGYTPATVGWRYGLSVWAKGTGNLRVGALYYYRPGPNRPKHHIAWQEQRAVLTDQWQEVTLQYSVTDPYITRIAMAVGVWGKDAVAYLDDAALRATGKLLIEPRYAMVKKGEPFSFEVTARKRGWRVHLGSLKLVTTTSEGAEETELPIDLDGVTEYELSADPEAEVEDGLYRLDFSLEELGARATAYVHVVDEETYNEFAEAAARTKIEPPTHLLFLGDSLTVVHQDHNYVDEVGFWLRQVHGEQVTYRNAGGGGDYITRVWQRLNGDQTVYRPDVYDDLYEPLPTRVFIFLGHNDSKLKPKPEYTSPDDYEEPVVSPEDYYEYQRMVVQKIQAETGAEFTLISNTSSVYEVCAQRVIDNIAAGKSGGSLFGKPEVMEQFNEVLHRVAQDTRSSYVDVYEPTRTYPDKPSLFLPDGVHLNAQGNFLVALEILRHLGE